MRALRLNRLRDIFRLTKPPWDGGDIWEVRTERFAEVRALRTTPERSRANACRPKTMAAGKLIPTPLGPLRCDASRQPEIWCRHDGNLASDSDSHRQPQ